MKQYLLVDLGDRVDFSSGDLAGVVVCAVSKEGFRVIAETAGVVPIGTNSPVEFDENGIAAGPSMQKLSEARTLTLAESINVCNEASRLMQVQSQIGHLKAEFANRRTPPAGQGPRGSSIIMP